jgi:hypothetical protein
VNNAHLPGNANTQIVLFNFDFGKFGLVEDAREIPDQLLVDCRFLCGHVFKAPFLLHPFKYAEAAQSRQTCACSIVCSNIRLESVSAGSASCHPVLLRLPLCPLPPAIATVVCLQCAKSPGYQQKARLLAGPG